MGKVLSGELSCRRKGLFPRFAMGMSSKGANSFLKEWASFWNGILVQEKQQAKVLISTTDPINMLTPLLPACSLLGIFCTNIYDVYWF